MADLAEPEDVARVLNVDADDLPESVSVALAVASRWARRYLKMPNLGEGDDAVTSMADVRDDGLVPVQGTPTRVQVRYAAGSSLTELGSGEWTADDYGVRLRPPDREGRDPRFSDEVLPRTYVEVVVTSDVPRDIDADIVEGVAHAAAAIMVQSPRLAKGLAGENIGDYSYTVLRRGQDDPLFGTAKAFLRPARKRGPLVA